jgi:hypothetical protein
MRFLTAIQGGSPDALALSIWNNKLPGDELDRQILDLGVCVVVKSSVWRMEYEGVKVEHQDMPYGAGRIRSAITYQTKYGTLREVKVIEPGTSWVREFVFKSPEDYRALETIITARCYEPDFLRFRKDDERYGDGSIARPATIHSPFQELIYEFMGMEAFSMEYLVNPGRLSDLELVLAEDWSKRLEMVQRSPARYSVIEGNTDARMVGPDMFLNHYHPYIQEACKRVHSKGILAGAHLDSDNRQLANQFNQTDIDLVESLTPPPDCPMSVSEARKAWPGKAIQVHFPSSVHLYDGERMKAFCKSLLDDLGMKQGVVVGISEDLPGKGINTLVPMFRNLREFEHRLH